MYTHLPMFQRIGSAAYKANLDNTLAICNLLNNPQQEFISIHVAGTNGKGSTSHMLAAAFSLAGYKTGLYTSPHLKDFRERIKIDGKMIPKKYVANFINHYQQDFEKIQPSFFEMTVGLAFNYFKEKSVEIAIIETGLGGRLDSTNVIKPIISVITNISMDHMALLGDSIELIATEKAGIIKNGTPIVIGETQQETKQIFISKAKEMGAEIFFADQYYEVSTLKYGEAIQVLKKKVLFFDRLNPQLKGMYQQKNIATVLQTIEIANGLGLKVPKKSIAQAIENVVDCTGLMGRWQILHKENPLCIADTGHNEAGIKMVLEQINNLQFQKLHFVLGMVNDKDVSKILSLLPKTALYYFCKANIPRGLDASELAVQALKYHLIGETYKSVKYAYQAAKRNAKNNDLVFVGGSTFTVAEVV
ncbi:MAG TPA: folylpolyglutamate synthase/dihydrofolate synthase family protein [Bacteroidia bacterium]|nr:folylpolyglutamate synthase/dihydrofolate synthase family protein [Bacteroidia bacterium]